MNTKKLIIIALIAVIVVLGGLIAYTVFTQNQVEYQTIAISNATTMEVPVSENSTFFNDSLGIKYYQDEKSGVQVISWNGQEQSSTDGAQKIGTQFENQKVNTTQTFEDGVPVYENKKLGCFIIEVKNATTNDNIIIVAKDKDVALHMLKSIKFGVSNITNAAQVQPYTGSSGSGSHSGDDNNTVVVFYPWYIDDTDYDSYDYSYDSGYSDSGSYDDSSYDYDDESDYDDYDDTDYSEDDYESEDDFN